MSQINMSYAEKLKDPRWQKKRLQIMERDGWRCTECGDPNTTLHVHHLLYLPGREPWEYYDEFLITLCEDCHEREVHEDNVAILEMFLVEFLKKFQFDYLWGLGEALSCITFPNIPFKDANKRSSISMLAIVVAFMDFPEILLNFINNPKYKHFADRFIASNNDKFARGQSDKQEVGNNV